MTTIVCPFAKRKCAKFPNKTSYNSDLHVIEE